MFKIVSGGQTGADMGALLAARQLGFETGGFAPRGWLTENGPEETLLRGFGLTECPEAGYPARTRANTIHSDGTLILGDYRKGGSRLTFDVAHELEKPVFLVEYRQPMSASASAPDKVEFQRWLRDHNIKVLNVAGNRESENPGICEYTRQWLIFRLEKTG